MTAYLDIKAVDHYISERIARDRWVIAPSMISKSLEWSICRTIAALGEIYREQIHQLKPSLTALCDYCSAEALADSVSSDIFDGNEPIIHCPSCGKPFHCTEDNARLSFHVLPSGRRSTSATSAEKEVTGGPLLDTRQ